MQQQGNRKDMVTPESKEKYLLLIRSSDTFIVCEQLIGKVTVRSAAANLGIFVCEVWSPGKPR